MSQTLQDKLTQAESAENAEDFFRASFFYKETLKLARDLGDSQRIKFCKKKLIETNQKLLENEEFIEISVERPIKRGLIEKFINSFLAEKDLFLILYKVGKHPSLYPKFDRVKETAKKTIPKFSLFGNQSVPSAEGHLIKNGEDVNHWWFMEMYTMEQGLIMNLYLRGIFVELLNKSPNKGALNEENLIRYFRESEVVPEETLNIIGVGIKRYFEKDFISAIHILVPRFENLFLHLSGELGIDIIALNQTKEISTQTKTLSSKHLDSDEFQRVWGKDLCQHIKFVFFDPLGYKLRHKVAHGEIHLGECNFDNATLVLYFFLVLIGRGWQ